MYDSVLKMSYYYCRLPHKQNDYDCEICNRTLSVSWFKDGNRVHDHSQSLVAVVKATVRVSGCQ